MTLFNLLREKIIPVEDAGRRVALTLPSVFSRLCRDQVGSFTGLAAHQAQSWYHLLAQLGAVALHRGGLDDPPTDQSEWRDLLLRLTPGSDESEWSLVVPDSSSPAFLQPPTAKLPEFKSEIETPDALDVLVTAKNHDRKQSRAIEAEPHHWLYALVVLQTAQGYSGKGGFGIARMNGGYSSRVLVDRRPSARWGMRVVRAMRMLIARRSDVLRAVPTMYSSEAGLALTWLREWDTDAQVQMSDLDPFFIEVCRRVRLMRNDAGRISARVRSAKCPRVNAKLLKGRVGDPWVPINLSDATALTVGATGFNYRLVQRILFSSKEFSRPLALKPLGSGTDRSTEIHMMALVRGQGRTDGLHERVIPIPPESAPMFDSSEETSNDRLPLEELSNSMVQLAGSVRKVLRRSVLVYLQGPDHPNFKKPDATSVIEAYDRDVDSRFFSYLFDAPRAGMVAVDKRWQQFLNHLAIRHVRELVWRRMTPPTNRREKARAASEGILFGGLRSHLQAAYADTDQKETH